MKLKAITEVKCAGTFWPHEWTAKQKLNLHLATVLLGLETPISIPCVTEQCLVNVGELMNLRLRSSGHIRQKITMGGMHIYPSFTTYNIKHTPVLSWSFALSLADESIEVSGGNAVTILAPIDDRESDNVSPSNGYQNGQTGPTGFGKRSESWMHPPPAEDAPSSLAEVQGRKAAAG